MYIYIVVLVVCRYGAQYCTVLSSNNYDFFVLSELITCTTSPLFSGQHGGEPHECRPLSPPHVRCPHRLAWDGHPPKLQWPHVQEWPAGLRPALRLHHQKLGPHMCPRAGAQLWGWAQCEREGSCENAWGRMVQLWLYDTQLSKEDHHVVRNIHIIYIIQHWTKMQLFVSLLKSRALFTSVLTTVNIFACLFFTAHTHECGSDF